jgi:hypothetical protein
MRKPTTPATFTTELQIDWSQFLGHECTLKLWSWSDNLIATTTQDGRVEKIALSHVGEWLFEVDDPAVNLWKQTIPSNVLDAITNLPSLRCTLLEMAVTEPKIQDLLLNNPVLLWRLFDAKLLLEELSPEHEQLLNQRQRDLCRLIGLNGTKQQVSLLKLATQRQLSRDQLLTYIELLKNAKACQFFSHHKSVTPEIINVLKTNTWLVSCNAKALIPELCSPEWRRIFDDVLRMLEDISALRLCATTTALQRLHDRLVEDLNELRGTKLIRDKDGQPKPIPEPPLQSGYSIEPITRQMDLIKEGREMRHCIASHLFNVVAGDYAVYRMAEPERLTIEVLVTQWGQCFIKEVRGKGNKLPSAQAMQVVEQWFQENQPESNDSVPNIDRPSFIERW